MRWCPRASDRQGRRRPAPARRLARGLLLPAALGFAAAAPAADFARSPGELLAWMDADGDARVSVAEYQDYLGRGFRAMDANGDGIVDASELPEGATSRGRRAALSLTEHEQRLARAFGRQDADGDGYLDAEELAAPPK